jgi:hypothetical protein
MSWAQAASWLTVAGSLLLTFGTGAQAWANLTEYRDLFKNASTEVRQALQRAGPDLIAAVISVMTRVESTRWQVWAVWRMLWAFPMIIGIPLKMATIREAGGEEAVRLARLLRQAAVWSVLMAGSVLIMAAVAIQLALSYA